MRPSSSRTGMWTVISFAGMRKTLHVPSSSLRRAAASSNRVAAASQGFFSSSSDIVLVAKGEPSGLIMARSGDGAAGAHGASQLGDPAHGFLTSLGVELHVAVAGLDEIEHYSFGGDIFGRGLR